MRRALVVLSATVALAAVVPAPAFADGREPQVRYDFRYAEAGWAWHKVSETADGVRTYRDAYFRFIVSDSRSAGESWTEDQIYVWVNDHSYRADGWPAGGVQRRYVGTRDTVTLTIAPDYRSARITGVMEQAECDPVYCGEPGPAVVDLVFTATADPVHVENESGRGSRWFTQVGHVFSSSAADATASGTIGNVPLPRSYGYGYQEASALAVSNCRADCDLYE